MAYLDNGDNYNTFRYQMLGRLKQDCDYFLGNGCGHEKFLCYGSVSLHIKEMRTLHDSFAQDKKPHWLTIADIEDYERRMLSAKAI